MNLDYLDFLPEWEDDQLDDAAGEEWKAKESRSVAKALYLQWRDVFGLVLAFAEDLCNDPEGSSFETHRQANKKLIYENALVIAPKIVSAAGVDLYILQMENSAIIRTNSRQLMEQVGFAILMGFADESYQKVRGNE